MDAASFNRPLVVVIGKPPRAAMVASEVVDVVVAHADVATAQDADSMAALILQDDREVAIAVVVAEGLDVDATVERLARLGALGSARLVVVTGAESHRDLEKVVDRGQLVALVMYGTPGIAGWIVAAELRSWMVDHGHDPLSLPAQPGAPARESPMMTTLQADEEQLVRDLFDVVEVALGPRALIHLPEGTRLTRQGEDVDGVYLVLEGTVALTRTSAGSDLLLHHASTGPVVGLLALTRRRRAFFTATATSEVVVMHLSIEQLDRAMRLAPHLGVILASLSMRTLTQRLLRSEELQFERNELIRQLEAERQRLATALRALEEARMELISQARFATLGELSAGVAHELNNPVAAISGVAQHLTGDVRKLTSGHAKEGLLREVMDAVSGRAGVSTSEQRRSRRAVEAATEDPEFAWEFVGTGITDVDLAVRAHTEASAAALAAANLAGAARNLDVASSRILELVQSLRSYSRPETELVEDIDLHVTLDDTIHLLSNRLKDVEIVREFGTLPRIAGRPSQLSQVWTNILVNAVEALGSSGDAGRIEIVTRPLRDAVQVEISDNGPGIDPEVLPRIFEPQFTTKRGTVRYGLGLGMGISRRIVEEHGGVLTARSRPGRTEMTATLPVAGPHQEAQ
ncbi:MAG TPA: ATP-binding protein [Actinomycetaceae bacterium]|nr:ATP-binding protein [Actinomycetaceae bacterium]